MIVVLSGEGPTDLGQCGNAQNICQDGDFHIGPMTALLDQMLAPRLGCSPRTTQGGYIFVSEGALVVQERARKNERRKVSLVGKKRAQETGFFYINAWMLGDIALQYESAHKTKSIAVLFRDCDGSRSSRAALWAIKWESMLNGFARADYSRGVPMLPKPKSEVWLLCAAKPAANCSHLEKISGNDASPKSAKSQLNNAFGIHKSGDELCEWLDANHIDENKLSTMPSFLKFKERLDEVVAEAIH